MLKSEAEEEGEHCLSSVLITRKVERAVDDHGAALILPLLDI